MNRLSQYAFGNLRSKDWAFANFLSCVPIAFSGSTIGSANAGDLEAGLAARQARNFPEAIRLFNLAASNGSAEAQYNLAMLYYTGAGGSRDIVASTKLFRLASARGHPASQYSMGVMYPNGIGVAKSLEDAADWYRMAAAKGNSQAVAALKVVESKLTSEREATAAMEETQLPVAVPPLQRSYGNEALRTVESTRAQEQLELRAQWERQQLAAQQAAAQQRTQLCMAAMYSRPTKTGALGESMVNAAQCNSDSNAHLIQLPPTYTCRRDFRGEVQCTPQ